MNIPKDLLYTPEHFWVKEENGVYRCGITDFAQDELGDLVFVELPKPNRTVKKGDKIGDVESIKTVSNLYSPLSGVITEVNSLLENKPEVINQSPYEKGWICVIQSSHPEEIKQLLSSDDYNKVVQENK